jgi:hypothetical protein
MLELTTANHLDYVAAHYARTIPTQVLQLVAGGSDTSLAAEVVGLYNNSKLQWYSNPYSLAWPGGGTSTPADFVQPVTITYCAAEDLVCSIQECNSQILKFSVICKYDNSNCTVQGNTVLPEKYYACTYLPAGSFLGILIIVISAAMFTLCASYFGFACLYVGHELIPRTSQVYDLGKLMVAMFAMLSPLINIGFKTSSSQCLAIMWIDILPVFFTWTVLLHPVYQIVYLMDNVKPGAIHDDWRSMRWISVLNSPLVILLFTMSLYDPPKLVSKTYTFTTAAVSVKFEHSECVHPNWTLLYVTIGYVGLAVCFGLWVTSRSLGAIKLATSLWSKQNSARHFDLRLSSYAVYALAIELLLTTLAAPFSSSTKWTLDLTYSSLAASMGVGVAISFIWLPKVRFIFREHCIILYIQGRKPALTSLVLADRFLSSLVRRYSMRSRLRVYQIACVALASSASERPQIDDLLPESR